MAESEEPLVYLSYSHESHVHKQWVRRLAGDLIKNGIRTTLDQWHLHVGDDIGVFMEQSVKNATYIVLVCTEIFAEKANDRKAGVGYEQAVFVGELLNERRARLAVPSYSPVRRPIQGSSAVLAQSSLC